MQETPPEKANQELQESAACSGNSSPYLQKGPLTCQAAKAQEIIIDFSRLIFIKEKKFQTIHSLTILFVTMYRLKSGEQALVFCVHLSE